MHSWGQLRVVSTSTGLTSSVKIRDAGHWYHASDPGKIDFDYHVGSGCSDRSRDLHTRAGEGNPVRRMESEGQVTGEPSSWIPAVKFLDLGVSGPSS